MREIEFKVWDSYKGEWLENCVLMNGVGILGVDKRLNVMFLVSIGRDDRYIKCLYTGLKDKNGKKIYGGNIVERNGVKFKITFEIGSFMIVKINEDTDMYEEFDDCWNDHVYPLSQLYWNNGDEENYIHDLEVIGNTYDNPELLEVSE